MSFISFTLFQKFYSLCYAEMVPVRLVGRLTACQGDFLQRANQREGGGQQVENIRIGLTLEIADEKTKKVSEIEQEQNDKHHIENGVNRRIRNSVEKPGGQHEEVQVAHQENQDILEGVENK